MDQLPALFYSRLSQLSSTPNLKTLSTVFPHDVISTHAQKRQDFAFHLKLGAPGAGWEYCFHPDASTRNDYLSLQDLAQIDARYIRIVKLSFVPEHLSGGRKWFSIVNIDRMFLFVMSHMADGETSIHMRSKDCLSLFEKLNSANFSHEKLTLSYFGQLSERFLIQNLIKKKVNEVRLMDKWPKTVQPRLESYLLSPECLTFHFSTDSKSEICFNFEFFERIVEKVKQSKNMVLYVACRLDISKQQLENFRPHDRTEIVNDNYEFAWIVNDRKVLVGLSRLHAIRVCSTYAYPVPVPESG
ncbi:hypothetical protein L596_019845 [Steinernema carpocapsae]|uniref:Uncharacterized protein n=1 Tax=Steinernema carpocapsae TaxID=34508 RepID=A0A4U5MRX6_STECR|nr:hypothetical protein L596_019845 [Steinernema carpocapsae]